MIALELEPMQAATLAGALITAKHTLEETLVQVPAHHLEAALAGIAGVEELLGMVERAIEAAL